ncbi:unnamed protein product [marine sediment metagenome]|uniref:Uncharacterized protein n=1 Tax=marine sediment metagenome TaxID=412755 RepID=X1SJ26_9ZZZZ
MLKVEENYKWWKKDDPEFVWELRKKYNELKKYSEFKGVSFKDYLYVHTELQVTYK